MDSLFGLVIVLSLIAFTVIVILTYIELFNHCLAPILVAMTEHKIERMKAEHEAKIKLIKGLD